MNSFFVGGICFWNSKNNSRLFLKRPPNEGQLLKAVTANTDPGINYPDQNQIMLKKEIQSFEKV